MGVSLIGLLFALLSALSWGVLDALRKRLTRDLELVPLVVVLCVGQAPLFIAWALASGGAIDLASYWPFGLVSIALNLGANLMFVHAVRVSPLSVTIPFLSFAPVFAALVAIPTLGERPSLQAWLGIALVVLGAILLTRVPGVSLLRALAQERGSLWMVCVAALWGFSTAVDKFAIAHAAMPVHALISTLGVGSVLFLWLLLQGRLASLRPLRAVAGLSLALVGFAAAALGFQLLALPKIWVGVVEALKRAVGLLMSLVIGRLVFREPVTGQKLAAVLVMVVGTVLVTVT